MKKISLIFLGILLLPNLLLAVTDEFTIKVLGGDDFTPPTTPTLLNVIPVAQNQIDISWSASVDNYLLSGYVLSRDGLPIATTTLTTFIDTGLTAETLYTYEVFAFDSFGNISTTSNQLATTTLAIPVVATSTPVITNTTSATKIVAIKDLQIITNNTTARLAWQTNFPARYTLRWGRSDSYTEGYVLSDVYRKENETIITDLEPGAKYYYELVGYLPNGIAIVLSTGDFSTQISGQTNFVPNVLRLQAEASGEDVILNWLPPEDIKLKSIRVVRSHLGFPIDINDGAIVFNGIGSNVRDVGAFEFNKSQYYTVFVIGEDGTVSSGAVTLIHYNDTVVAENGEGVVPISLSTTSTSTSEFEGQPQLPEVPLFGLELQNILIEQAGKEFSFLSDKIDLVSSEDFIIRIPKVALPENLKSIIVTLLDPTDQRRSYSFLLRINKERTAYESIIAPLGVVGASRLQIEVFDYKRMLVGRYRKPVDFVAPLEVNNNVIFPDAIFSTTKRAWPLLLGLSLMLGFVIFFIWHRKDKLRISNSVDL